MFVSDSTTGISNPTMGLEVDLKLLMFSVTTVITCVAAYLFMNSGKRHRLVQWLRSTGNEGTDDCISVPFIVEDDNGSAEEFEHTCDICDKDQMIEAVRFCQMCQQFMCYPCSERHSKYKPLNKHDVIPKEKFSSISKRRSLFTRQIAIIDTLFLDNYDKNSCTYDSNTYCNHQRCAEFVCIDGAIKWQNQDPFEFVVRGNKDRNSVNVIGVQLQKTASLKCGSISTVNLKSVICDHKTCKVYICTPKDKTVYWFKKASKDLTLAFKTKGECHHIALFNNGFAVTIHQQNIFGISQWQVHYLTNERQLKRQIVYDKDNKELFHAISDIASNVEGDKLYVADYEANSVTGLGTLGNVLLTFTSTDMSSPSGLSVDYEGNIYIACDGKVIQLHSEGKRHRELLKTQLRLSDNCVKNVFFDSVRVQLVVMENDKNASIYNFLP